MGTDKQLTVTVSFKEDEKWLYDEICSHSCKSAWVKEILIRDEYSNKKYDNSTKSDNNIHENCNNSILKGLL